MPVTAQLRRELLSLSPKEREALADELYDSLDAESLDPAWESAWVPEIQARMTDVEQGRVDLVDAEEVHRDLRTRYRDSR